MEVYVLIQEDWAETFIYGVTTSEKQAIEWNGAGIFNDFIEFDLIENREAFLEALRSSE